MSSRGGRALTGTYIPVNSRLLPLKPQSFFQATPEALLVRLVDLPLATMEAILIATRMALFPILPLVSPGVLMR